MVVGSRVSYLFAEKKIDEVHKRIENSINYILFLGIACAFGISAVAPHFVPIFYGAGYDAVKPLLYIFSPIIVIIGVSNCIETHYYIPSGNRAKSNKFLIAGAVFNFLFNLILIPKWGAFGAAVASVCAELLITILYIRGCESFVTVRMLIKCGWKRITAGIIMFAAVRAVSQLFMLNNVVLLAAEILIGALAYIVMLIVLKDEWFKTFGSSMLNKLKTKVH